MINDHSPEVPEILVVPRTDPIYNCHSYLTKVPVGAIRPFIEAFSKPGDTVVDPFAGSGMTGIAALQTGRSAVLSDISELGKHVATGYLTYVPPPTLLGHATQIVKDAKKALGDLYEVTRASDLSVQEMVRTVWSFVYKCPTCGEPRVFFEDVSATGKPPSECQTCGEQFSKRTWPRGVDLPVEVVVRDANGKQAVQPVGEGDLDRISRANADNRLGEVPSLNIGADREMYVRSALAKAGLTETKAFFSARNAIALFELWNCIASIDSEPVRQKLMFAFTAILPRASRRYQWSPQRPLNAQNQTYYIAPVYYEWNIFELFERKVRAAIRSDVEVFRSNGTPLFSRSPQTAEYHVRSAHDLSHIEDGSIEYVFTDPPFGSNIFYSDMSLFQEAWLGVKTDETNEAVVHTGAKRKAKSGERYERLLIEAFKEAWRILKPDGYLSVVFGNSNGVVWGQIQRALSEAGFENSLEHVSVLDKGQRSVKGLSSGSEGVVTVDLVFTVRKTTEVSKATSILPIDRESAAKLVEETVAALEPEYASNPSYVYARVLMEAVRNRMSLDGLHFADVLTVLRRAGYAIDRKSGQLMKGRLELATSKN